MIWYKVKWIDPLFDAFNQVFPNRAKDSDGTIGDTAHQAEVSGHNPDDTPGVQAERQDADNIPEVRAADVTSTLYSSIRMYDVVQRILTTPADRDRLIYIICDGWIWRASGGWVREKYNGTDQHFGHAHFSGHPDADENNTPWESVLSMGDEMLTDREREILENTNKFLEAVTQLNAEIPLRNNGVTVNWPNPFAALLKAEGAGIVDLQSRAPGAFTDAQINAIANSIATALVADRTNTLTDVDLANVVARVKQALREGTG